MSRKIGWRGILRKTKLNVCFGGEKSLRFDGHHDCSRKFGCYYEKMTRWKSLRSVMLLGVAKKLIS